MSKSKPYSAVDVNRVALEQLTGGRAGRAVVVGFDIGKLEMLAAPRWGEGDFSRPWRVANPGQVADAVGLLVRLAVGRQLRVALEPSGTYGDALRQALHDAGLLVLRVSPKAAHDYAEVFDGVPSQHDGKDACVVAELAALGKAAAWPYQPAPEWEQELGYWVDWLEAQRQLLVVWAGRLEGLLGRHWPEATRVLKLTRATLLRALAHYGGPAALAADEQALARLLGWGGRLVGADKLSRLLEAARSSVGVRQGDVERRRVQQCAAQALEAVRQIRRGRRELAELARCQPVLVAQAKAVGGATACVLWAGVGDPRDYGCGEAYRKAMGLNLTEYSSGKKQGELHISKRGSPQVRRWLYLAALRLARREGVRGWYQAKRRRDGRRQAKKAVVAVMRKLALALYQVGAKGAQFEAARVFPGQAVAGGEAGAGKGEGSEGEQ
jgi:transposase